MEYWIFIILTIIAICVICLLAFFLRCTGYKKVMKKIRTVSMSSSQDAANEDNRLDDGVVVPAPPPYIISLQHPIIARSTADVHRSDDLQQRETHTNYAGVNEISADTTHGFNVELGTGAFPIEGVFMPPPYCLDPPPYCEIISETSSEL